MENISAESAQISEIKKTEEEIIKERKEKIVKFFRKNYNWVTYILLALIVALSVRIRTRNIPGLRDITTGDWALGPDLDPWLFWRWAKYIVENGSLMDVDYMRYVPLGFETKGEYLLHPYMIAYFHKIAALFGSESVTQSAILYPVFMFALTVIFFFLFVRKIFIEKIGGKKANLIGLISAFFLTIAPSLLPRTIAGIPEKESAAFLFLFMSFYFFLCSWNAKSKKSLFAYGILAGVASAGMAQIWGGYIYIYYTIALTTFVCFLIGNTNRDKLYSYSAWLISSFVFILSFFDKFQFSSLFGGLATGSAFGVFCIMVIHSILFETKLKRYLEKSDVLTRFSTVTSTVVAVIIVIVFSSLIFSTDFIPDEIREIKDSLVKPATSRLIQTVAENRQPYFAEWAASFGPMIKNFHVVFWLFIFGSITLFWNIVNFAKNKERIILTCAYVFLLLATIFNRYSSSSVLNGENFISLGLYALGFILFVFIAGRYYYRNKEIVDFAKISIGMVMLIAFFFLGILSAKAAVRTVMILAIPASVMVSYFVVVFSALALEKKKILFNIAAVVIILLTLFAAYGYYTSSNASATAYFPSSYNQQWQKAMSWVRENTSENSVFGHWWDYGYWVQSIGERATVLDGGNAISYWNYLMGRYALTGTSNLEALEFLYAHNTTHFLIDSTDIGKYSAFSTIGSDVNYDRQSFIPTFYRDLQQVQERKNSTVFIYAGGVGIDEDILYEFNGTSVFLPSGRNAGLGAILIEKNSAGEIISAPIGVFVYENKQYSLPFKYAYYDGDLHEFDEGIEAGVFIYPRVVQTENGAQVDMEGALLYLSKRTVNSQLARLYLYHEENENFRLVHSEDDFVVAEIKRNNPAYNSDFIDYGGLRGPIRIWEIDYPDNIEFKEEYLSTYYPEELKFA